MGARPIPSRSPRHAPRPECRRTRLTGTCAASRAERIAITACERPGRRSAIGLLHGLAGTGAVVVLLLAALPTRVEAALSLAVFAPMTIFSMAACTTAFAWVLTRPLIEPVYRSVLIPALGLFGLMFGLWYVGADSPS